jgi:hypothetical protein
LVTWSGGTYERLGKYASRTNVLRRVRVEGIKNSCHQKDESKCQMAQKAIIGVYNIKFVSIIMPSQKVFSGGPELNRPGLPTDFGKKKKEESGFQ